ncbi:MAG: cytochrome b/b6 domain-containing protein, partial [Planctomycetota bacterium]
LLLPLLLLACLGGTARADNDTCFECHGDEEMWEGEETSAFVDRERYAASVHKALECAFCHQDLEDFDIDDAPHATDLAPVDCAECHESEFDLEAKSVHGGKLSCWDCHAPHYALPRAEDTPHPDLVDCTACHEDIAERYALSTHGKRLAEGDTLAPFCWDCHGTHDVLRSEDERSRTSVYNVPLMCGRCHQEGSPVSRTHEISEDRILENYSQSIHGEGLFRKGLKVTAVCTSCHTAHDIRPHEDPESSINPANVAATCETCHGGIERIHTRVIDGKLWQTNPDQVPICVECHAPHEIRSRAYLENIRERNICAECHAPVPSERAVRDGVVSKFKVDLEAFRAGVHGHLTCVSCHAEATAKVDRACMTIQSKVDCAACHEQATIDYAESTHGQGVAAGDPDAPTCLDCHDQHAHFTLSRKNPTSMTFARNVPDLCARCHKEGQPAAQRIHAAVPIVEGYLDSIHGRGLRESGLLVTATCVQCHTAHRVLPPDDPTSSVNDRNVADTCGRCHYGIEEQFRRSIHWPGNGDSEKKLPTCKECHTSHSISRKNQGKFRFLMMDQCGRCHESEAATFFDTYHGKVSRLGDAGAAKCYDCHGAHGILPPADPASTLSRENVVATCGKCHEGSHRRFAGYLTHATHHDSEKYPWLFWTFWSMTALLVGTLSVALLHTALWLFRLYRTRDEWRAHKAAVRAEPGELLYRRFNRYERLQHLLMLLSFFTLALTGMALKFSYTGWAQTVSWLFGGFDSLGSFHRFAAVVLFGVFVAHVTYVVRRKRASGDTWKKMLTGPNSLLFTKTDLIQFGQSLKWFVGKGPRPHYGRWTYWEKFDYFAVLWGVFIIGMTGVILWFPVLFTHIVPGWFVNVATIIHSDEALLAVGFIFTVHFFNTHFRPDKFPMDEVVFTGRVPVKELQADKPAEYEALKASGRLEEYLVKPFPKGVVTGFRIFGFFALGVGLLLIASIVYSMLFAYR